jgi:hypothetical protein
MSHKFKTAVNIALSTNPATGSVGDLYYDTTSNSFKYYTGAAWNGISGPKSTYSTTPPSSPSAGDYWINSNTGLGYVYIVDANSSQWVDIESNGYVGPSSALTIQDITTNSTAYYPIFASATSSGGTSTTTAYTTSTKFSINPSTGAIVAGSISVGGTSSQFLKADGSLDSSTYLTGANSTYIGTTAIPLNRTSASQTLTGVSIDGNAGTVTNGIYTSSTIYIGTTAIALNRASGAQTLSGVSISGNAGTVTNGVYTTDTGTVTNTMLANSSITINGSPVSLGGTITITGLPSQTGNAGKYLTTDGTTASWATVAGGTGGSMNYAQTQSAKVSAVSASGVTIVSTSITTSGNPVQILVTGDAENTVAGGWIRLQLFRGTTAIGKGINVESSAASENIPYALTVIDTPTAGTYTYSLQTVTAAATGAFNFGEVDGPVLTAVELNTLNPTLNLSLTGNATADQFISTNNGNGTNFKVGDDVWIGDINVANTMSIKGQGSASNGFIRFGSDTNQFGFDGTNLVYGGGTLAVTNAANTFTTTQTIPVITATGGSSDPTAPSSTTALNIYSKTLGGKPFLFTEASGSRVALIQNSLFQKNIGLFTPGAGSTTLPPLIGSGTYTQPTTAATLTARTLATTNNFTRTKRIGFVTSTTAGRFAGVYLTGANWAIGDGSTYGGFYFAFRFGISDATLVASPRMFLGLSSSVATPTNVEPSTLTNVIGVGMGAADTNLKIFYGGSAAQTPIDLGTNFPVTTATNQGYEVIFSNAYTSNNSVSYQVINLNTGTVATGTLTAATPGTQLPASSTFLGHQLWRTNNATAAAVGLDLGYVYCEGDAS